MQFLLRLSPFMNAKADVFHRWKRRFNFNELQYLFYFCRALHSSGLPHQIASSTTETSSPLPTSPHWSRSLLMPVWQCFLPGCKVKFLLPDTDAPWQTAEELAWKDRVAINSYQYAPHGLTLIQVMPHYEPYKSQDVDKWIIQYLGGRSGRAERSRNHRAPICAGTDVVHRTKYRCCMPQKPSLQSQGQRSVE